MPARTGRVSIITDTINNKTRVIAEWGAATRGNDRRHTQRIAGDRNQAQIALELLDQRHSGRVNSGI